MNHDNLNEIAKTLQMNNISAQNFLIYYAEIKKSINPKDVGKLFSYLMLLFNASVIVMNQQDNDIYDKVKAQLQNDIANVLNIYINGNGINFTDHYMEIKYRVNNYRSLSFGEFDYSYNLLEMAILSRRTEVDLADWAKLLLECNVSTFGYDETIKLNGQKKRIRTFYYQCIKLKLSQTQNKI